MNLVIAEALAESGRKCGRLVLHIQVRDVAERQCTERSDAFATLFGYYCGYRSRRRTGAVPEDHGRYAEQMAEKYTF